MIQGVQGTNPAVWSAGQTAQTSAARTQNPFAQAMAAAAWAGSELDALSALAGTSGNQNAGSSVQDAGAISNVSAWGHTSEVPGTTLEEMLRNVHPQLTYHVMDCSSSSWRRNDYPHDKLFQKDVNKYEIEHWEAHGEEPTQANSPSLRNLSRVAPGSVAVVIHPAVQEKMDADPEYAREIFDRIEAWFAFDEARNTAIRQAHGDFDGSGIEVRSIAIGEDGMIANAMASGGGRITQSTSGSDDSGESSWWDKRMQRHDQYMKELVEHQIEHKALMSQQLASMSMSQGARQTVMNMMADPAMRAALGEKIGGTPIDTVFSISMQHINAAMGI